MITNKKFYIIAGPCSIDYQNLEDIYKISKIYVSSKSDVDVYSKGDYRNLPVHQAARRVKVLTGAKLLFDPSHIHGPKLHDSIVKATVEVAKMMIDEENYLYDGALIEVGRSKTDIEQHITIEELDYLCQQISEFRELVALL